VAASSPRSGDEGPSRPIGKRDTSFREKVFFGGCDRKKMHRPDLERKNQSFFSFAKRKKRFPLNEAKGEEGFYFFANTARGG